MNKKLITNCKTSRNKLIRNSSKNYLTNQKMNFKINNYNSFGVLAKIFPVKNFLKNDNFKEKKININKISNKIEINKKKISKKNEQIKNEINRILEQIKKNKTQITLSEKHNLWLMKSYEVIENHKNPNPNQDHTKIKDAYEIKDETYILLYKTKIKNLEKKIKELKNNVLLVKNLKNVDMSSKYNKWMILKDFNFKFKQDISFNYYLNNQTNNSNIVYTNITENNSIINSIQDEIKKINDYINKENYNFFKIYNNLKYEKKNISKLKDKIFKRKEIIEKLKKDFIYCCKKLEIDNSTLNDIESEYNINRIREKKVEDLLFNERHKYNSIEKKYLIKYNFIELLKEKNDNYFRESRRVNSENKLEIDNLKAKIEKKKLINIRKKNDTKVVKNDRKTWKFSEFKRLSIIESQYNFDNIDIFKPLLRVVNFDDINILINNLRFRFISKNIPLEFIISLFNPMELQENFLVSIEDIILILRNHPFNIENEDDIINISRYIVEDNYKEKNEFDLNNSIDFNIIKSIIRSLFKNYKIFSEETAIRFKIKLKSSILPQKKKIISTFTQIMNIKNDIINIQNLKENFIMNEVEIENDIFIFLIMSLFKKSNNIQELSIKELFLIVEN